MDAGKDVRAVKLGELIDTLGALVLTPLDDALRSVAVRTVAVDSRKVEAGDLFVAVEGTLVDGHDFIADARDRGAVAVIAERGPSTPGAPVVLVENSARALALLAARINGDPAADLRLCGVTGTNGKTSTAHLVRSIMREAGRKMGIIGTLGHGVDTLVRDPHTTPDALTLHSWFRVMRDQHCFGVVMEVSSHAVRQHRTWGLDFEVGILTNVTHDHLDFHKTMSDYKAAKAEFCYSLAATGRRKPAGTLVFWLDDANAREIGIGFRGRKVAVGSTPDADWRVHDVDVSIHGTRFALSLPDGGELACTMKLLGGFVPANAALAAAAAAALGATTEDIRRGLESVAAVPGRFEALGGDGAPVVVIDYAHTPDGFERVLQTCRALKPRRLVTLFGCGGDRDRDKRPVMGGLAERYSDRVYLTTDNPRSEDARAIVDDVLRGMMDRSMVTVELDRPRAIDAALAECGPDDLVALLGKGHEEYQIIGRERIPYSERAQAEGALARWRAR
ncbi:MAG TPA: UDP-N-acetylmuramoyl-L-alanyl-D-glutamate--2,6-diaminopimelate ligase [Candidatus Krumholzibacteria bacterium]|nr:UDP-N-acetylmuramoyl-L-alanyl-D-glutamate--2,6-diaminopimelate ligase [Candidatus Krumholzibacteria bacterium]